MLVSDKDKAIGALLGVLVGLGLVVFGTLGIATALACGTGHIYSPDEFIRGVSAGLDFRDAREGQCGPGRGVILGVAITGLVLLSVLAGGIVWAVSAYKTSDRKFIKDIERREGIATGREVNRVAGRKALRKKAGTIRPGLEKPQLKDVGRKIGVSQGQEVWTSLEDSCVLFGPPRSGKGFYLVINAILDSPGAVVATSTRGDNVAATIGLRRRVGPCTVFDPQGLSGVKSSLKWSPFQGCEDPEKASVRAQALMAATGLGKSNSNQEWAQQARIILQMLLHAAALGKVRIKEFARWGSAPDLCDEAVEILLNHPDAAPGWGANLKAEISADPKTRQSKWLGVVGATEALTVGKVAESLDPGPDEKMLDPEEFIRSKGTLYLLGSKSDGSAIAPFLIALMDEITNIGRRMAKRMPGNRLDPPMSVILDEIANLAPWESLPQLMADGGGTGISPFAIFQSPAQVRNQWGADEAQALVDSAILQIQLGGSNNTDELRRFTDLMDQRTVQEKSRSVSDSGGSQSINDRKESVLTVGELRRMPTGYGLLLNRNGRPVVMKMTRWIDRKDVEQIKASKKKFEELMATGGELTEDFFAEDEDTETVTATVGAR